MMSEDIDIVYFHPPRGAEIGWMRFVNAKEKERAHVFRPVSSTAELMESLCGRWLTRAYHSATKAAMLTPAEDDRPRCKLC